MHIRELIFAVCHYMNPLLFQNKTKNIKSFNVQCKRRGKKKKKKKIRECLGIVFPLAM